MVLSDGTPVLMSRQEDEAPVYHDLKDALIENNHLSFADGVLLRGRPGDNNFAPLLWQQRIQAIFARNELSAANCWYFVHDGKLHGHGYLVGYDPETKLKIGYIGRSGFGRDVPPLAEQFPVNGIRMAQSGVLTRSYTTTLDPLWSDPPWTVYLLADDGLFEVNLQQRAVKPVYKARDVLSFAMTFRDRSVRGGEPRSGPPPVRAILLREPDRVIAIDLNGGEFESYAIPAEARNIDLISWYRLPKGKVLGVTLPSPEFVSKVFWSDSAAGPVRLEGVKLHIVRRRTPTLAGPDR